MKKIFVLLLVLMLAFSLAACGENEDGGASGTNDAQGGQSTSGDNSTAPQGGNDTNKNDKWTDADAETITKETKAGTYVITFWEAKNTTEIISHPGSSKHKISHVTGYTGELYAPFKIIYTNTYTQALDVDALSMGVHSASRGEAIIYAAFEGDSTYQRASGDGAEHFGLVDTKVQPGETVTIYGYIELNAGNAKKNVNFGNYISVVFRTRPEIQDR